jgi:hypothetical protein
MERMATSYFKTVYARDPSIQPSSVVNLFDKVISDEVNVNLCLLFSEEEISDAIFQIGPLKAPGPDGFLARFYQRNWGVLKQEIIQAVLKFFEMGVMPEGINDTSIVSIPKVDHEPTDRKVRTDLVVPPIAPLQHDRVLIAETSRFIHVHLRQMVRESIRDMLVESRHIV